MFNVVAALQVQLSRQPGTGIDPTLHSEMHIKDVLDDEQLTAMAREVKFVGVTRLGELLVLPICSTNVLHSAAVDEAVAFMNEKDAKVAEAEEPAELPELPPTGEEVKEQTKEIAVAGTEKA